MIKYEAKNGDVKILSVSGNVVDITADVAHMIHLVYEGLKEQDEKSAEEFKKCICFSVKDDGMVFNECCEEKKEEKADALDEINKQLDDLLKKIKAMGEK